MKRCKICGAYLDPGEWCDCEDDHDDIEEWTAWRPTRGRQLTLDDLYARSLGIDKEEYLR